jgi:hypothetical protein
MDRGVKEKKNEQSAKKLLHRAPLGSSLPVNAFSVNLAFVFLASLENPTSILSPSIPLRENSAERSKL